MKLCSATSAIPCPPAVRRVDLGGDRGMVRGVDRRDPRGAGGGVERGVARHGGAVADRGHRVGRGGVAVAVDHQPRVALMDERRVERARERLAERGHADVPADVPRQLGVGQAEPGQRARHPPPAMVADQQQR